MSLPDPGFQTIILFRRVWESLVKRRVEAESFEEEAREKDLSLAEVV